MDVYKATTKSNRFSIALKALDEISTWEWTEHMAFGQLSLLPIEAPVMTVTRAFLKPGDHSKEYYRKISDLKAPIEKETDPFPCVYSWTVDATRESHKWLMFVGWQSKRHHRICLVASEAGGIS